MYSPTMPPMKLTGISTASSDRLAAATALNTSDAPRSTDCTRSYPSAR